MSKAESVSYNTLQQIRNWQICKIPEAAGQVRLLSEVVVVVAAVFVVVDVVVDVEAAGQVTFLSSFVEVLLPVDANKALVFVAWRKCFLFFTPELFRRCLHNLLSQKSWKQWMFSSTAKRNC